ncbi:MAG: IclR family transcriptional regulator [Alicyclobacillus macrosporangiidus]|uniref:IclR family transcriptional regulator n=1 Tax=Alicyclobacillus macrosporangiidus TaxID=392015 RepID=UPI0026EFDE80|nr:IclR family transcriptional regulator [Alicyclobacillus macrosporangiidus]MCL6598259.1 IclR family transcriptional regulator [Alicyclobacillus macrosporangiidus]
MQSQTEQDLIRGKSLVIHQEIDVLDRLVAVLDCLDGDQCLSLSEIAKRTGLPKATCFRLLQAMQSHHFVRQEGRYYGLGSRMFAYVYAHLKQQPLAYLARPLLRALREQTGLTALLCVRQGAFRVVIAMDEGDQGDVRFVDVGQVAVIYAGSPSKVLLAWLSREERDAVLADVRLQPLTERTICCREAIEAECELIRQRGWAMSRGEREPTAFSVSVPIRDAAHRVVAALALTGPLQRLTDDALNRWLATLTEAGASLSARLRAGPGGKVPGMQRKGSARHGRETVDGTEPSLDSRRGSARWVSD